MVVGVRGHHGNHAARSVERETEYVLEHVLIQLQNGTEEIALGQIAPQRAAICTSVKVDVIIWTFFIFLNVYLANIFYLIDSTWQLTWKLTKKKKVIWFFLHLVLAIWERESLLPVGWETPACWELGSVKLWCKNNICSTIFWQTLTTRGYLSRCWFEMYVRFCA